MGRKYSGNGLGMFCDGIACAILYRIAFFCIADGRLGGFGKLGKGSNRW